MWASGAAKAVVKFAQEEGYMGPFRLVRALPIYAHGAWTGYIIHETEAGAYVVELAAVYDWGQIFIDLAEIADTWEGFSHRAVEVTFKNNGVTDIAINLCSGNPNQVIEHYLALLEEAELTNGSERLRQNADGTFTLTLNLEVAYNALQGQNKHVFRLKMFLESVPTRSQHFDRKGSIEFINVELIP